MAGRRRTGALAGAINLGTTLMLKRQEEARERQLKAQEYAVKWKAELALERAKQGQAYTDPFTGQSVAATSIYTPTPGLEVFEETDPITKTKRRNPIFSSSYIPPAGDSGASEPEEEGEGLFSGMSKWLMDRGQPRTTPAAAPVSPSPIASPPRATDLAPVSPLGSTAGGDDMVMVQGADGVTYRLPRRNLQEAIKRGAKPL